MVLAPQTVWSGVSSMAACLLLHCGLPPSGYEYGPHLRQASGHVLVRPRINDHDELGFFILDTGAPLLAPPPPPRANTGGCTCCWCCTFAAFRGLYMLVMGHSQTTSFSCCVQMQASVLSVWLQKMPG